MKALLRSFFLEVSYVFDAYRYGNLSISRAAIGGCESQDISKIVLKFFSINNKKKLNSNARFKNIFSFAFKIFPMNSNFVRTFLCLIPQKISLMPSLSIHRHASFIPKISSKNILQNKNCRYRSRPFRMFRTSCLQREEKSAS